MRHCKHCGQDKAESQFYKSRPYMCMVCSRARMKELRQTERGREILKKYSKRRYEKFREKYLARAKVGVAIKSGKLVKPLICSTCGQEGKLEAKAAIQSIIRTEKLKLLDRLEKQATIVTSLSGEKAGTIDITAIENERRGYE